MHPNGNLLDPVASDLLLFNDKKIIKRVEEGEGRTGREGWMPSLPTFPSSNQ